MTRRKKKVRRTKNVSSIQAGISRASQDDLMRDVAQLLCQLHYDLLAIEARLSGLQQSAIQQEANLAWLARQPGRLPPPPPPPPPTPGTPAPLPAPLDNGAPATGGAGVLPQAGHVG